MKERQTMRKVLACFSCLLLAAGLHAQIVAEYVDGRVEIRTTGPWSELFIGDEVSPDGTLRVFPGGAAELSNGPQKVSIRLPGEYLVEALVGDPVSSPSRLISPADQNVRSRIATGGVRASEAVEDNKGLPVSASRSAIERGRALLAEGLIDQARDLFLEAFDFAFSLEEESESAYLVGYSELVLGRSEDALEWFDYVEVQDAPWTPSFLLSYAQSLFEVHRSADALELLDSHAELLSADESQAQIADYFRGVILLDLGRVQEATQALTAAAADAETPFGARAAQVLGLIDS